MIDRNSLRSVKRGIAGLEGRTRYMRHRNATASRGTRPLIPRLTKPRALVLGLGLLTALLVPPPAGAVLTETPVVGTLGIGDSRFWDGEYVASSRGGFHAAVAYFFATPETQVATDPCLTGSMFCRVYNLEVNAADATLRVALDSSKRGECFALELRDPSGMRANGPGFPFVCPEEVGPPQSFNIEMVVPDAAVGTWQVRALGIEVEDWAFRMRATLEGGRPPEPDLLVPNLVPWLPSEFGFVAPASPDAGSEIDRRNPPGDPAVSCHPTEAPAAKCLRFSSGLYVTGDGPLYLKFNGDEALQHIYTRDNTPGDYKDNEANGYYRELPAGSAEFHEPHGHRHFADMVLYELFAVDDASLPLPYKQGARLTRIGTGEKHGYCTFSQQFENWFAFEQDTQFASFPLPPKEVCDKWMTLERGWGDVYRWQRPGQYVPYDEVAEADGTMRAGFYVVRVTIDPNDRLEETSEEDNVGYAYIQVTDGDFPKTVMVCERGLGKSPWDPNKQVAESDAFFWAKRLQDPTFTSRTCF